MDDIIKILKNEGFETVEGYDAVKNAIKNVAKPDVTPLCSGYCIFPDGKMCSGCNDCKK